MLLKLELNIKDDAGNIVKTCSILKCHKQEGDRVNPGDPLFDIEVSQILIPARLGPARLDARQLHRSPVTIGSTELRLAGAAHAAAQGKPEMPDGFPLQKVSYQQIIALDSGILRNLYTQEQTVLKIGEPMALLATDEDDPVEGNGVPPQVPGFRAAARTL